MDSNNLSPYQFDPSNIFLPNFEGAWFNFMSSFQKVHGIKKSKYIELDKKKSTSKKEMLHFKMKSKPDKKAVLNKSKPKYTPLDTQIRKIGLLRRVPSVL